MSETNRLDRPWHNVTITLVWEEDGIRHSRVISIDRASVEQLERAQRVAQAEETDDEFMVEQARAWELDVVNFERRVMQNLEHLLSSPIQIASDDGNSFRLLPAHVVREVKVEVNEGDYPVPSD
jgi:hypothetical protein